MADYEQASHWIDKQGQLLQSSSSSSSSPLALQADSVTFGLLLEGLAKLNDGNKSVSLANTLLDRLVQSVLSSKTTTTTEAGTGSPSTPSANDALKPLEWYFHYFFKMCTTQAGRQSLLAHQWLETWWTYHDRHGPTVIPRPTPEAYAMVMSGWGKEGNPKQAMNLLQDMLRRKDVQANASHFETCLTALVDSATSPKRSDRQASNLAYDAENIILQMNQARTLLEEEDPLSGRRSWPTRVLHNLNKVVHCWVDSREPDAAVRVSAIVHLMRDVFSESDETTADWRAVAEAHSHAIRAWSFLATGKAQQGKVRQALAKVADKHQDAAMYTSHLLFRLEELVDNASSSSRKDTTATTTTATSDDIPLKIWRRSYGGAIAAFGRDGDKTLAKDNCQHARQLWGRFHQRGYGDADIALYNHLFHVFGRMGAIQASELLWEELAKDENVQPDLKTYNWRLLGASRALPRLAGHGLARLVWSEIATQGFKPDIISYNTYLSSFAGTQDIEVAREGNAIFHELLNTRGDNSCRASIVSLNSCLRMWSILASATKNSSHREEAVQASLTILMEVHQLRSEETLVIRPNVTTRHLMERILDAHKVEEEKQAGVFRLLDKLSD